MKIIYFLVLTFGLMTGAHAQVITAPDTINPKKGNREKQLQNIESRKEKLFSDSVGNEPANAVLLDSTLFNKYGDLLNDDPEYNPRQPLWKPAGQVVGVNLLFMGFNRYVAKADYGYVDLDTWKTNLKSEPEWDTDEFGINFIGHPYQGTLYYNAARSQGYNFWQSAPFAVAGSVTWEYFGENTLPSYNDMIYTPLNGIMLGEIFYRISSNILDDRTRGRERVIRELSAGLINPVRGLNRLLQGKTGKLSNKEVYQKEPLNLTLFAGVHRLNDEQNDIFGTGGSKTMVSAQLDYGNPFEDRRRKPFDLFRFRAELSYGAGDTIGGVINNLTGYGNLFSRNHQFGKLAVHTGIFQYYDYWNTRNFDLGSVSFGAGVLTRLPITKQINLYTNVHAGLIPLAGNSTRFAPDSVGLRDYVYANGVQGKFETTLSLGKYVSAALVYHHFWIKTFEGLEGTNSIGILRPRVTLKLFKNLSLGYEHFGYSTNRKIDNYGNLNSTITDQKIFLELFLEDPQRRGRYN